MGRFFLYSSLPPPQIATAILVVGALIREKIASLKYRNTYTQVLGGKLNHFRND